MSNTRVIVVRHGQSQGNVDNTFCGHFDSPLTALGFAQARAAGRRLADTNFDAAFASDLSRTRDTAVCLLEGRSDPPPLTLDRRLREMYYGDWEGRGAKDLADSYPAEIRKFFEGHATPGGETAAEVRSRVAAAVRDAVSAYRGGIVLIVSHGNAIMAMLAEFLAIPLELTWAFACDNTSITQLQFSKRDRFTLLSYNDFSHILDISQPAPAL